MTYQDNFVVEVKQGGKILRVKDSAVYLPFGSEYSIYLKNLNSRRASVKISIDGEDVLDNKFLVLDANSSTELQGFLNGNVARNRFRFINKTKQISEHRGDRADDGLIRVEFAFEKPKPEPWITKTIKEVHEIHHWPKIEWTYYGSNSDWSYHSPNVTGQKMSNNVSFEDSNIRSCYNVTVDSLGVENLSTIPNNDEGITVKGSEINQNFRYTTMGELDAPSVIVIALKGITQTGQDVSQPITTRDKLICNSCGAKSNSSFKFCPNCGTFLE
jgi:hypothetical protein